MCLVHFRCVIYRVAVDMDIHGYIHGFIHVWISDIGCPMDISMDGTFGDFYQRGEFEERN